MGLAGDASGEEIDWSNSPKIVVCEGSHVGEDRDMGPLFPQVGSAAWVDLDQPGAGEAGHLEAEREAANAGTHLEGAQPAPHVTQSR